MTVNYTTLLGLAKPVTGSEAGSWGDIVNDEITTLVEESVAGRETISVTAGDVTLTDTNGVPNQARNSVLYITGTPGTTRQIIAPSKNKVYVVINASDSSVVIKGLATTGVTIISGSNSIVAWNGSDFEQISQNSELISGVTIENTVITPRIGSVASAATVTPTSATADEYEVTALATGATIDSPSGSPTDGQKLIIRIKDDGTPRALGWTTGIAGSYRAVGVNLPVTTVAGKILYVGCIYNTAALRWDVLSIAQEL